jgi:hypothetical protein
VPDGRNSYCQADRLTDVITKRHSEKLHTQYFPGVGIETCAPPDVVNRPKDSKWLTVRVGPYVGYPLVSKSGLKPAVGLLQRRWFQPTVG